LAKEELTKEQEQLARFAKAMGHPIRVAILQMLAKQTCCYHGDMSGILPVAKKLFTKILYLFSMFVILRNTNNILILKSV
jgi:DNA-binding transcriptional ArsR family regulator